MTKSAVGLGLAAALLCAGCASGPRPFSITEVSPGVFMGVKPRTPAEFDALKQHGIRTVLSLERFFWHNWPERRLAQENGITYTNVPILASPLEPSEKRVKEALLTLAEPSLRPIFMHCLLSEDRTPFIVGLYRVYYEDWSAEEAWREMLHSKFHASLGMWGFKTYFWKHTEKPGWVTQSQKSK